MSGMQVDIEKFLQTSIAGDQWSQTAGYLIQETLNFKFLVQYLSRNWEKFRKSLFGRGAVIRERENRPLTKVEKNLGDTWIPEEAETTSRWRRRREFPERRRRESFFSDGEIFWKTRSWEVEEESFSTRRIPRDTKGIECLIRAETPLSLSDIRKNIVKLSLPLFIREKGKMLLDGEQG